MKAGYHTDVWTRCAGAGHGTDVPFIFNTPDATTTPLDWDETAQTLGTRMQDVFINFARTGDPNIDGLPQWPKHTPDDLLFMIFDTQCRVSNDFVGAAQGLGSGCFGRNLLLIFPTRRSTRSVATHAGV